MHIIPQSQIKSIVKEKDYQSKFDNYFINSITQTTKYKLGIEKYIIQSLYKLSYMLKTIPPNGYAEKQHIVVPMNPYDVVCDNTVALEVAQQKALYALMAEHVGQVFIEAGYEFTFIKGASSFKITVDC